MNLATRAQKVFERKEPAARQLPSEAGQTQLKPTELRYQKGWVNSWLQSKQCVPLRDCHSNPWLLVNGEFYRIDDPSLAHEAKYCFEITHPCSFKARAFSETMHWLSTQPAFFFEAVQPRVIHEQNCIYYRLDIHYALVITQGACKVISVGSLRSQERFMPINPPSLPHGIEHFSDRIFSSQQLTTQCRNMVSEVFKGLDPYQCCFIAAWMVDGLFLKTGSKVLLNIYGAAATGKSLLMKYLARALDPRAKEPPAHCATRKQLVDESMNYSLVCLDGVGKLDAANKKYWLDILQGWTYETASNQREGKVSYTYHLKRPMVVTSRECITVDSDLFDRTLPIRLGAHGIKIPSNSNASQMLALVFQLAMIRMRRLSTEDSKEGEFGHLNPIVDTALTFCDLFDLGPEELKKRLKKYRREAGGIYYDAGSYAGEASGKLFTLRELQNKKREKRLTTGLGGFDELFSKGIKPDGVILLSGQPGAGKSTLALQLAGKLAQKMKVLYTTGEETELDIYDRSKRLGLSDDQDNLLVSKDTGLWDILNHAEEEKVKALIVDSSKTITVEGMKKNNNAMTKAITEITRFAKVHSVLVIILAQVNKKKEIAGSMEISHIVDVHMHIQETKTAETEETGRSKLFTAKNRFAEAGKEVYFIKTDKGIVFLKKIT